METSLALAEGAVIGVVQWLKLLVEAASAAVIGIGVFASFVRWSAGLLKGQDEAFGAARLKLARYLALALELALGADILATAIAPTWDQIGKLAAIAVIRTALNHFLRRELEEPGRAPAA